ANVVSVAPHSNAEKLSVCQVFDGENTLQVVCGAPNVRAGLVTAFARVGAVLPGDFKIKKAKLRGEASNGMLCSASEIGLGDDDAGIIELDESLVVGQDLRQALQLDDMCIELDLTPNRGDCFSMIGVAREAGVLNDISVKMPACDAVHATVDDTFPVTIDAPEACPRYLGRVIRDIDASQPAPFWMREKLRRSGLRSIDPIVDITNYVMLELGQPLHAFDLAELNKEITVRTANSGEHLTLLDGSKVTLNTGTLLITDANGPIAMAGIMGGEHSGIQSSTTDIFLESAFFATLPIAGIARQYGLHTDASLRYERGVDHCLQRNAIERATALILDILGGKPGPVMEHSDAASLPLPVSPSLRFNRLTQLVGIEIPENDVVMILKRLGLVVTDKQNTEVDGVVWTVDVPSHRFDIALEEDLVEEICRIYGYNNIPSTAPTTHLSLSEIVLEETPRQRVKQLLADLGYQEVVTYSFVEPGLMKILSPEIKTPALQLANPMSADQSVMRLNLLPGLVKCQIDNANRQQSRVRVFELGRCFLPGASDAIEDLEQRWTLGGLLWGERLEESWHGKIENTDFYDLKGDVEQLLELTGHSNVEFRVSGDKILHPGQSADLYENGQKLGRLGRLHPEIEQGLGIRSAVYVFELYADALMQHQLVTHSDVSRFPSVRRDLSLLLDSNIPLAEVESIVVKHAGEFLINFRVFDVYHGEGIDSTAKSIAVGLTFQHPSRTLTELEISNCVDTAVEALGAEIGARLR
ncbi:MAG: phenylalanine--tRNA ligase subunit beta, partial [Pseudomonadales bacterium]|nr:phenylalanine--tRNA ligase subunit beta [Pseudomonadales bacterium]